MSVILQITSSLSNEEKENRDHADDHKRAPKAIAETSTVSSSLSHVLTGINTGKGTGNMVEILNEQSSQRTTKAAGSTTTRTKTTKVVFDENVKMDKRNSNSYYDEDQQQHSTDHPTIGNSLVRQSQTSTVKSNSNNSRRKSTNSNASTNNYEDESSSSSARLGRSGAKNSTASSRMLPFNDRLRNMFELFRSRLNTNPNPNQSSIKCTEPSSKQHRKTNKKSSSKQQATDVPATKQKATSTNKNLTEMNSQQQHQKSQSTDGSNVETCELCLNPCQSNGGQHPADLAGVNYLYQLETCEHSFCVNCLRQYLKYQITESRVSISCPQCSEKMHPSDIYRLLLLKIVVTGDGMSACSSSSSSVSPQSTNSLLTSEQQKVESTAAATGQAVNPREWSQLIDKYEEFALRRALVSIPDTRWCPAPDCTYAVIASGCANCPQLHCLRPNCNTSFCYHCKQYWHPNLTCEDAALRQNQNAIFNSGLVDAISATAAAGTTSTNGLLRSILGRSNSHISSTSSTNAINSPSSTMFTSRNVNGDWIKEEIKRCPKCQALIVKMDDGSCNHITCSVCGCEFCWLCMKEISDLHYLSPSGCTFWGKKPWSRKKKILWQLGTLIGAPVGIALIAGVAVPAILIGLPIWAGRKVYIRYKNMGKHRRNLIVIGTVVGTIVVAPLVAALAVGIGVPILLAYVYGVVPISLCRSGGCGVTTNNNGGVRFAFDDETTDNQSYFNTTSNNQAQQGTMTTGTTTTTTVPSTSAAQSDKIAAEKSNPNDKKSSSSRKNSFFLNSVTIPISAIGSKADSIIVSTLSNSNEDVAKNNQATTGVTATAPLTTNTSTSTSQSQTPLFVTITMGNKATSNSITYSSCAAAGSNQLIKGRHQRVRYRSSSSSSSHRVKRSASLNNKKRTKASIMNSVSVACGTVEMKSLEKSNKPAKRPDEDEEAMADRTMASETGTASCYLKEPKYPNNLTKKLISNRIVNNPSIGETSLGVASYTGDDYNSGMDDLDYIEEVLQSAAARQNRVQSTTMGNVLTNNNKSSNKQQQNNNARIVRIINKKTTLVGRKSTDLENEECYEQMEDHSDRDSASNRALAGDLAGGVGNKHHSTNSSSVRLNFDKKSLNKDESDYKMDVKSNYTINSYEKTVSSLMADADAYSVSILSEKSINPSVAALVGSIKDNVSISNFST